MTCSWIFAFPGGSLLLAFPSRLVRPAERAVLRAFSHALHLVGRVHQAAGILDVAQADDDAEFMFDDVVQFP